MIPKQCQCSVSYYKLKPDTAWAYKLSWKIGFKRRKVVWSSFRFVRRDFILCLGLNEWVAYGPMSFPFPFLCSCFKKKLCVIIYPGSSLAIAVKALPLEDSRNYFLSFTSSGSSVANVLLKFASALAGNRTPYTVIYSPSAYPLGYTT